MVSSQVGQPQSKAAPAPQVGQPQPKPQTRGVPVRLLLVCLLSAALLGAYVSDNIGLGLMIVCLHVMCGEDLGYFLSDHPTRGHAAGLPTIGGVALLAANLAGLACLAGFCWGLAKSM